MSEAVNFHTPVGELQWIFITGKGKKDLNDNDRFVASVVLDDDSDACQALKSDIDSFWNDNKPKGAKQPKSTGYKAEVDPEGNETGRTSFNFWTGTEFPDGRAKVIKVFNAKGAEVALGDRKIGNGSIGRIGGAMGIYSNGPNKGVTLYLNSLQLKKFVEFTGGDSFEAIDDDDDDDLFEGFDGDMPPMTDEGGDSPKPRL